MRCGRLWALLGSGSMACAGPSGDGAGGTSTSSSSSTSTASMASTTAETGHETSDGADSTSAASDVGDSSGSSYDLVAQDCPPRHECMPVFVPGMGIAPQCALVDADPLAPTISPKSQRSDDR